jgi:hypothetical protein
MSNGAFSWIRTRWGNRSPSSMALQPFRPWPLFQFVNPIHSRETLWTGYQPVERPLPKHRTTQNKRKQTSMPRVGFEPSDLSVREGEDGSCLCPRGHCDLKEKPKYSKKKTFPSATLLTTNPWWPDLVSKPGRLSYGTALRFLSKQFPTSGTATTVSICKPLQPCV